MEMKKCLYKIALSLLLITLNFSCENLGEEIRDELSSNYRFYKEKDSSSALVDSSYKIGESYSIGDLFPEANDGSGSLKQGYYATGWVYWKNPDSTDDEEEIPSTVKINDAGLVESVTVIPQDADFYASSWKPITYYVKFDANGGAGEMTTLTCEYDSTFTLPANSFTRSGYKFRGWLKNSGDTDIKYADEASDINLFSIQGSSLTLYAYWLAETSTIYFHDNFDSSVETQTVNTEEQITLRTNTFSHDGYTFGGWSDSSGYFLYSDGQTVALYGDLHLYALWNPYGYIESSITSNGTSIWSSPSSEAISLAAWNSSASKFEWYINKTECLGETSNSEEIPISYSRGSGTYTITCYVYDSSDNVIDICMAKVVISIP